MPTRRPARRLVVVTCMDARLEPLAILGLELGDAHVIRNAGARATADALASVELSASAGGTERAIVIGHTDCAAHTSDEDAEATVRATVDTVRRALPAMEVSGAMYDLGSATLRELATG